MESIFTSKHDASHKVLIVIPGSVDFRGIQIFFINILKYLDYTNLAVDLYFGGKNENEEVLSCFIKKNNGIFIGNLNFSEKKPRRVYRQDLRNLLQSKQYDCIHVNSGMPWFNLVALEEAKKAKVKKRILHSHSAHNAESNPLKILYKKIMMLKLNLLATELVACSKEAGIWMFGQRKMKEKGIILYNGIDAEKYTFSQKNREEGRTQFAMSDKHILLHVGAFNSSKNQMFLVEMFSFLKQMNENAKLILIGTGPNLQKVKDQVKAAKLENDVMFIGSTNRVSDFMQMADLFILPSVFEGLGIVNIEAQAAGLRCMVSDVVPEIVRITNLVEFIPLSKGPEYWAEKAMELLSPYERENKIGCICNSGFNARMTANRLQEIYDR